jgi:polyisoprenoid-binding protein YceI
MLGKEWLDASGFPTITFTIEKLIDVLVKSRDAQTGNVQAEAKAVGTFTLHGTTKPLTTSLSLKFNKQTGLVMVNTQFALPWKDYGIKGKRTMGMTVGDVVQIDVQITAKS